ncbi:unnamed protein product [Lepeophtheirus salmonis]|uniref:(salmon louse) hypothetical protein n=1 Tax=Lepeophtheirus salmonis TaxID=72036 RepID=A0A817FBS5_LEPSM|nr:unnamed protein product [Lepeophtheirus salmonis]CAG9476449.1 unnamed protein product [Lepeophtheirus salmonis]
MQIERIKSVEKLRGTIKIAHGIDYAFNNKGFFVGLNNLYWIIITNIINRQKKSRKKVCHEHFKKEDYDRPGGWDPDVPMLRKCLKKGVVPLTFLYRRSTEPSFHEERYKNCQHPNGFNTTQDGVKVRYFEDNVLEVELEVRDSKEEHREEDANWYKSLFLSIKTQANDSEAAEFYTRFHDLYHLIYFFNFFGASTTNLNQAKKEHQRFRTCSLFFCVSKVTAARVFRTWLAFLYIQLQEYEIWPSKEVVQQHMPKDFKTQFPATRVVLDATKIAIQKPKNDPQQVAS